MTKCQKLSISSILASCSIILSFIGTFNLPIANFIKIDFSDMPIFIITLLFGKYYGILTMLSVSIIKIFIGNVPNFVVFLMRVSSIVIILFLDTYVKKKKNLFFLCVLAIFLLIMIRLPLSYALWTKCYGIPKETFLKDMLMTIITFVTLRTSINLFIAKIIFNKLNNKFK